MRALVDVVSIITRVLLDGAGALTSISIIIAGEWKGRGRRCLRRCSKYTEYLYPYRVVSIPASAWIYASKT